MGRTQTQNAAFFERKGPERKPWPGGMPLKRKIIATCFLNASVLARKSLNCNLSWGFPFGNLLTKTRVLKRCVLERKRELNANASVLGTQRLMLQSTLLYRHFEALQLVVTEARLLKHYLPRLGSLLPRFQRVIWTLGILSEKAQKYLCGWVLSTLGISARKHKNICVGLPGDCQRARQHLSLVIPVADPFHDLVARSCCHLAPDLMSKTEVGGSNRTLEDRNLLLPSWLGACPGLFFF